MKIQETVADMEAKITAKGGTVAAFCRDRGIARSTWDRWKTGETEPQMRTWRHTVEGLDSYLDGLAQTAGDAAA